MARLAVGKRFDVLKRDGFTCQYCGRKGVDLEVDHVIPRCQGGSDEMDNLKAACVDCNRGKSGVGLDEVSPRLSSKIKYAIHVMPNGAIDWVGEIVERTANMVAVETADPFALVWCGLWSLSGEVKSAPASEWRLFADRDAAVMATHEANREVRGR